MTNKIISRTSRPGWTDEIVTELWTSLSLYDSDEMLPCAVYDDEDEEGDD